MTRLGPNLSALAKKRSVSQRMVAHALGLKTRAVNNYFQGVREPTLDNLVRLADYFGVTLDELVANRAPRDAAPGAQIALSDTDFSLVPRYEVDLSAGPGVAEVGDIWAEALAFRTDWMRAQGIDPARAGLVRVRGVSMQPTVPDGSLVLVDLAAAEGDVVRGIYAFAREGELFIKRLIPMADALMILSDGDPDGPAILTRHEARTIRIIGRVRSVIQSL